MCGISRWKIDKFNGEDKYRPGGKRMLLKSLRYFPLKPRLQRLHMSSKTASLGRSHHDKSKNDGIMSHLVKSIAWKSFYELHKWFISGPRNVKLGLTSDGFQPFTKSKTSYSIWYVSLIPYNLPPKLCIRQSHMILSMLILRFESPGDAIDTYLQPLVEEWNELWEFVVETCHVSSSSHSKLQVYSRQLMIFLDMACCLVGILRGS